MVKIKPLQAIIYNYGKNPKPNELICPPYDIISPSEEKSYRYLSPYNMVNLTLPKDIAGKNKYQGSSQRFHSWLKRKILLRSKQPAIFFYQQEFKIGRAKGFFTGQHSTFKRLGIIGCLGLDSSSCVYGHEHTRIEPKEDRFRLLSRVRANLEPIFVLFSDPRGFLQDTFNRYVLPRKPLVRFQDQEKNKNILWELSDPAILNKIKARLANKPLFIADGHHRYEVSLKYQDLMNKTTSRASRRQGDFNYIMAYFCPMQSSGLVVGPIHRLVKGVNHFSIDKFKKYFSVKKVNQGKFFSLMRSGAVRGRIIGMYNNKNFFIFTLKNAQILSTMDRDYRSLDVCLLNELILNRILRLNAAQIQGVAFSANPQDLIRQAAGVKTSLVFFLRPVSVGDIISLSRKGKKMPAKTTYFYPKVPSGLVIYRFEDNH